MIAVAPEPRWTDRARPSYKLLVAITIAHLLTRLPICSTQNENKTRIWCHIKHVLFSWDPTKSGDAPHYFWANPHYFIPASQNHVLRATYTDRKKSTFCTDRKLRISASDRCKNDFSAISIGLVAAKSCFRDLIQRWAQSPLFQVIEISNGGLVVQTSILENSQTANLTPNMRFGKPQT